MIMLLSFGVDAMLKQDIWLAFCSTIVPASSGFTLNMEAAFYSDTSAQ
jgi:hypothetical protein